MFKTRWTIWERFWAFLEFWNFFKNISKTRPSMEHWAKKFSKKFHQNMLKTCLGLFWERFWALLEFWNFFDFLKTRKNYPKTCSKHVWTLLGTILGIFGILQIFWFFDKLGTIWAFFGFWIFLKTFRRLDPPWNTGQKNFWKKLHQNMFKTRLDKLGTVLGVFWILKIFQKHFEDSTLLGTLDKKISRKIYPKTCWKHVWTLLWTILGIYGILKIFWFIKSISKTRPSMEHWLKNFRKIYPKTRSKQFSTLLGTILGIFGVLETF